MQNKADYILDFRETITAFGLLELKQIMREMGTNEVLEIITRDPSSKSDVFKMIPASPCELVETEFDKEVGVFRIQLKKILQHSA